LIKNLGIKTTKFHRAILDLSTEKKGGGCFGKWFWRKTHIATIFQSTFPSKFPPKNFGHVVASYRERGRSVLLKKILDISCLLIGEMGRA